MSTKDPQYLVHTGDTSYYFESGRPYKASYLRQIFRKRVKDIELFPGVVFQDEKGNLVVPKLQVVLVPAPKPEKQT